MANAAPTGPRRRPVRAVTQAHRTAPRPSLSSTVLRLAASRPARATYMVLGTVGLAALALAVLGPKRLQHTVLKPLQGAVEPQTDKLWAQARPLRAQIASLLRAAGPGNRERLAKSFQSWIGHFHAT